MAQKEEVMRKSKVIRVSTTIANKLNKLKESKESWDQALNRLINDAATGWVLPQDFYATRAKARGEAMKRAVVAKKSETEEPIKAVKVSK